MAPFNSFILLLSSCTFFLFVVVATKNLSLDTIQEETHHYHTIHQSSFFPSSVCNPSTKGEKKQGTLEVVHKHGPCSKFSKDNVKPLTIEDIYTHDQARVDFIRAKSTHKKAKKHTLQKKTTLPANSGYIFGLGNYFITVGLGTPKRDLSLSFDTGSDLTWTQCQPCIRSCYSQIEPIFAPSTSTTYTNISCTSTKCSQLINATGNTPSCISSTCVYGIEYGDQSFSSGFFAKEKLTLTSKDVVNHFYFGCGQNNQGLFGGEAGLLGLGKGKVSIVSQTAKKYGKVFSYCLPSPTATGYLTFGSGANSSKVKYTPIVNLKDLPTFYGLNLISIFVGGTKLAISPKVFKTSGMIIDSGTTITMLPPTAYSALSKAFRAKMTKYPLTKGSSLFDTCYDLSNYTSILIPTISMLWDGNTKVDIPAQGILFFNSVSQVCLAYAANKFDSDLGVFGNIQQTTMEIVYDVKAGKVGFAPGGCD